MAARCSGSIILLAFDDTDPLRLTLTWPLLTLAVLRQRTASLERIGSGGDALRRGSTRQPDQSRHQRCAIRRGIRGCGGGAHCRSAHDLAAVAELVPFLAPTADVRHRGGYSSLLLTAGAPTLAASAEKVGLVQEFHDIEAAVTAGAPVVSAAAELVEGGVFEVASGDCRRAAESSLWTAESVGLAQPFHDTAAALTAGPASVAVSAELVGLANEFHDVAAVIEAGPPSPRRPGRA